MAIPIILFGNRSMQIWPFGHSWDNPEWESIHMLTFINNISTDMAISTNVWNVEDLKKSIVFVLHLALDMLNHHIWIQLHDDVQGLLGVVLSDVGHVFVQIAWKRPSSICMDCNKDIFVILHSIITRSQQ